MRNTSFASRTVWKKAQGVALPVVLMFLLVITILGALGIRRAVTGEALSRNQLDYEVARQAAEAALRDAERDLMLPNATLRANALCPRTASRPVQQALGDPHFGTTCPNGQCRMDGGLGYYAASNYLASTVVNPEPWWPTINGRGGLWGNDANKPSDAAGAGTNCTFTGSVPLGTFTGLQRLSGVGRQPEYLIEYFKIGDDKFMRVTARGFGANVNTEVVVQSYFRPFS